MLPSARKSIALTGPALALLLASAAGAQTLRLERLSAERLAVAAPAERVVGEPGRMRIATASCPAQSEASVRRRILDIAVQEWGYFGFNVVDQTVVDDDDDDWRRRRRGPRRRFSWLDAEESGRVAASIGGYWSVTADGEWILSRQNAVWNGPDGVAARWRDPWSAAFVSWVMCESGLGTEAQFHRHVAHYVYIDQAIEARDDSSSTAAYAAYDVGELPIEPGDLLCSARRSAYRSIAERRPHIGVGMRSHCDIVVKPEAERGRILAIGGNVRGTVSLKLLPATFAQRDDEWLADSVGRGRRTVFAHLKLRAAPVERGAFESTPTLRALGERDGLLPELDHRLAGESAASAARDTS